MKNFDMSGRTVVITGASKGIGAAAARAFAKAGAKVGLLARSKEKLEEIAQEIGENAVAVACDVSDPKDVNDAFEAVRKAFGDIDVLINNAGVIDPIGPLAEADISEWTKLIDINVKGVMYGMRMALPPMIARGSGTIINISSGAAYGPIEGWSAYCTSKAAVLMMTRVGDHENRDKGVRILGLSPGTVATDMQRTIKSSGINPVSQLDWDDHIPADWPAQTLLWMCTADADNYLGDDVKLRDEGVRNAVGLG